MADQDVKSISSATGRYPALMNSAVQSTLPAGNGQPEGGKDMPASPARREPDLEALAAKLNVANQSIGRDLRFKVDMASGESVIQVLDRETGEIIREIPPEKGRIRLASNGELEFALFDGVA